MTELQLSSMQNWQHDLAARKSLGQLTAKAPTLAALHEARRLHCGQFFTPDALVKWIWRALTPAMDAALAASGGEIALLDNSCGIGRMFRYADPSRHFLAGLDIHAESVDALTEAASKAGFHHDFCVAGMEQVRLGRYSIGIINPPFSLRLESPLMEHYPVCSHGRFGPGTAAVSHAYALAQALRHCDIVAAVIPAGFVDEIESEPSLSERLCLVAHMPSDAFRSEEACVRVAVAFFSDVAGVDKTTIRVRALTEPCPTLPLACRTTTQLGFRPIRVGAVSSGDAVIKTSFTGDPRVRVAHHGRRVVLKFRCGVTEAKVLNAVLRSPIAWHRDENLSRVPKEYRYSGDGALDLEAHLLQRDPLASFESLMDTIKSAGGVPDVDPGVIGFLRRRAKRMQRHLEPLAHVVCVRGGLMPGVTLKARPAKPILTARTWGAPVLHPKNEYLCTVRTGGVIAVHHNAGEWQCVAEEFTAKFEFAAAPDQWVTKFKGRRAAFPGLATQWAARARRRGIHSWLSFGYQFDDLVEMAMSPFGAICAWHMGLGKARLAAALCLIHDGTHNLVAVQAHLVDEMCEELRKIGIASEDWQVIDGLKPLRDLRRINVISYERLRMPIVSGAGRRTYAAELRHRISVIVADEGHIIRNQDTAQTKSLWKIAARRRYVLTGTVICNYPRDLLPVAAWCYGDGTAAQPYGLRRAHLTESATKSVLSAVRGIDAFKDRFMVLEWSTNEFAENLTEGAKREVPKIADLNGYRAMVAPLVKRRVAHEPEVARYIKIPVPREEVRKVEWDSAHFDYYLGVAEDFRKWFLQSRDSSSGPANLIAVLARIQAVEFACNYPQKGSKHVRPFSGRITSKQREVIALAEQYVSEGHKTIIFSRSPDVADLFARELGARGVRAIAMHGRIGQKQRTRALRDEFRLGDAEVLVATFGVAQTGLNIPEASRVIFSCRDWSSKTERQAMARVLRPQQNRDVVVTKVHLPGSIDEYMAQLADMKGDAADAGVDWAAPQFGNEEFVHIDTMLGRFVEDLRNLGRYRAPMRGAA